MNEIKNNKEVNEAQKINEGAEALTKNLGATDGTALSDDDIDSVEDKFDAKIDGLLNKGDATDQIGFSGDGVNQQPQNTDGQVQHNQGGQRHFTPSFGMGCTELCRKTQTVVGSYA